MEVLYQLSYVGTDAPDRSGCEVRLLPLRSGAHAAESWVRVTTVIVAVCRTRKPSCS